MNRKVAENKKIWQKNHHQNQMSVLLRYMGLVGVSLVSLFAGSSLVHQIYAPQLDLSEEIEKARTTKKGKFSTKEEPVEKNKFEKKNNISGN